MAKKFGFSDFDDRGVNINELTQKIVEAHYRNKDKQFRLWLQDEVLLMTDTQFDIIEKAVKFYMEHREEIEDDSISIIRKRNNNYKTRG